jgi:hypothetical protein
MLIPLTGKILAVNSGVGNLQGSYSTVGVRKKEPAFPRVLRAHSETRDVPFKPFCFSSSLGFLASAASCLATSSGSP